MAQQCALHTLLALPEYLRIIDVFEDSAGKASPVTIVLASVRRSTSCPVCRRISRRIHSRYVRTLADLPIGEHNLNLYVTVRRFFCSNPACPRRVFAEVLPDLTQPYARRTQRQRQSLVWIGLQAGGRPGARLAQKLGLPISFKALLHFVLASPCPDLPTPRVLGVDDWAFRKGHRYGTILYDLETHQPVELLPDRTAESLIAWLKAHPGVEIVSRDRASAYSEGAREGAPDAIQVADRFHLMKNLGDALERLLNRKRSLLKQVVPEIADPNEKYSMEVAPSRLLSDGEVPDKVTLKPLNQAERDSQHRRLERYLRYEQVRELYGEGHTLSEIARQTQLTRHTVRKFIRAETFPERAPRTGDTSQLDAHKLYLRQRWREGCHNAHVLWKELVQRGYCGGYTTVKDYLRTLRHPRTSPAEVSAASSAKADVSVRDVVTALLHPEPKRSDDEKTLLERLDTLWEPFRRFHTLAQGFMELVRAPKTSDQTAALNAWVAAAEESAVGDLVSFAAGIKKDRAAVVAGLSLPWNNGAVEGSVNRLKMIKRQMYGRAGFALLRRRVLEPT